jgi:hypothetical protein
LLVITWAGSGLVRSKVHRGPRPGSDGFRDVDGGGAKTKYPTAQKWYDKTYDNDNQFFYRHIQNNGSPNRLSKNHSEKTVRQFAWDKAYCAKACDLFFHKHGVVPTRDQYRKLCLNRCLRTRRVSNKAFGIGLVWGRLRVYEKIGHMLWHNMLYPKRIGVQFFHCDFCSICWVNHCFEYGGRKIGCHCHRSYRTISVLLGISFLPRLHQHL